MVKIVVNSSRGRIIGCPNKALKKLYKLCSYRANNYQFSDAYLNGFWDGMIRKFSLKTNSFPSGLLFRVSSFLKENKIKFLIEDQRKPLSWNKQVILKNLFGFKFTLRPYQINGIISGIRHSYLVFWWATSSGKTVLFSGLISALKTKDFLNTLIIVATKDLAAQHREEIGGMLGEEIGLIEEGRFEPKKITVAVINTLWIKGVKKKDKKVLSYLEQIDHLIMDESHRVIDSKMMKNTINKCKNTMLRHGFSGTPYSLTTDDTELECITGPPLSKVKMSDLIKEGWVSRPKITMVEYISPWLSGYSYQTAYPKKIVNGDERNKLVADIALSEFYQENSVLVLVRIIKHGLILRNLLLEKGLSSNELRYIHGSTPMSIRKKVKDLFRRKEIKLVIASQIWNEGIDIPSIDVLIKADGGGGKKVKGEKGVRSVIQQVGRVLRKPVLKGNLDVNNEVENIVEVYDFFDDVHDDLLRHSKNRLNTYKMEKEFWVRKKFVKFL